MSGGGTTNIDLSAPMLDVMERIGKCAVTAAEIGINGLALTALSNRGLLFADRNGEPTIYSLTPKGEALIELLSAPPVIVECEPPVSRIQRIVAGFYRIPKFEMWSQRRGRHVARPRQVAMYLARELTPLSLPGIGKRFGKRDHTTVMWAIRKVEDLIGADPKFAADIRALRKQLDQSLPHQTCGGEG